MLPFKLFLFILFETITIVYCAPSALDDADLPIVRTKIGDLRGTIGTTLLNQRKFLSFRGIRYAKPPIGPMRFRSPRPIEPWTGIRDASNYGSNCIQTTFNFSKFWGEEDCLFLNVYTPRLTSNEKMAVIFFIHGGGYMSGGSSWHGPELLLNEDIVLVTINYRLGPFGFLALNTPEYSGNMGLKDQILALQWVNENIEFFGGDRTRITLYGQSSGASCTHLLTLIPSTRGLYQRFIASSGSILNPWALTRKNHTEYLRALVGAEKQKHPDEVNLDEIIEYLKNVNGNDFGEKTFAPVYESGKSIKEIDLLWAPVIENNTAEGGLITRPIEHYLENTTDVDALFGYTSAESIILAPTDINNPDGLKTFQDRFEVQLPLNNLNYSYFSKEYDEMIKDVRAFYFGDKTINENSLKEFVKLLTDVFFIYGIDKSVKAQAKRSNGKTYYYQFSVEMKLNGLRRVANASTLGLSGATHIEDLFYLFKMDVVIPENSAYDDFQLNTPEGQMSKKLVKFFTNFVKYGNPIPDNDPIEIKPVIESNNINFVDLTNDGPVAGQNPHAAYIQFWDEFLQKHKDALH